MAKSKSKPRKEPETVEAPQPDVPRHGFQGNRGRLAPGPLVPAALTIAVSREAGSRGGTIARRVGKKIGWQVYNQEMLDYIAQEEASREDVIDALPAELARWARERLRSMCSDKEIKDNPQVIDVIRIILALGAQGEAVLVGRGAGCILPREATLHVRIVAPLADRIAYMSQWLRLTMDQAAEQVAVRDSRRADFITSHFHLQPSDVYQYDLLLNSSLLGEDLCVELIAQAARAKQAARSQAPGAANPPSEITSLIPDA